ncbi:MAG: hypothetical protein JSS00_01245 [Proteobacteria bacterium]|nr:hypothetical protein [Pseudomonadota bacterium]
MEHSQVIAIPTNVRVDDQTVITSGFALMTSDNTLTIEFGGLRLEFVFSDNADTEMSLEHEQINEKAIRIRLKNFKNALGSSVGPTRIGTLNGRALSLGLYVTAVGDIQKAVSYCLTLG